MDKASILKYIEQTPYNTNINVLRNLLDNLESGSDTPDEPALPDGVVFYEGTLVYDSELDTTQLIVENKNFSSLQEEILENDLSLIAITTNYSYSDSIEYSVLKTNTNSNFIVSSGYSMLLQNDNNLMILNNGVYTEPNAIIVQINEQMPEDKTLSYNQLLDLVTYNQIQAYIDGEYGIFKYYSSNHSFYTITPNYHILIQAPDAIKVFPPNYTYEYNIAEDLLPTWGIRDATTGSLEIQYKYNAIQGEIFTGIISGEITVADDFYFTIPQELTNSLPIQEFKIIGLLYDKSSGELYDTIDLVYNSSYRSFEGIYTGVEARADVELVGYFKAYQMVK